MSIVIVDVFSTNTVLISTKDYNFTFVSCSFTQRLELLRRISCNVIVGIKHKIVKYN